MMRVFSLGSLCLASGLHVGAPGFRQHVVAPRASLALSASPADAADATTPVDGQKREAYFCNEEGCWIGEAYFCDETGCWVDEPPKVTLPDGRTFTMDAGVESHADLDTRAPRKKAPQGLFAPAVLGAKQVLGTQELNKLRAEVISQHSKVISAFVDTSESQFGQIVLKQMFEAADKDGNGTLDREEVRDALHALGFKFIKDKQLDIIFDRADMDNNQVIDFEEFVKETPKTLRSSLIKLAKQNGHDLGFLA